MAATNYTPIQHYRSATAAAVPSAGALQSGELAINYKDGKLFYKDDAGAVQTIGIKNPVNTSGTGATGSWSINASTATTLQTARTINGVSFNGSANIEVKTLPYTSRASDYSADSATLNGIDIWPSGGINIPYSATKIFSIGANAWPTQVAFDAYAGKMSLRTRASSGGAWNPWVTVYTADNPQTSVSGNAATATTLQNTRTINGVSFNGSANIVVDPYTDADTTSATAHYVMFAGASTAGYQRLNVDSGLSYIPSTGVLTASGFSGPLTGNASTATKLATARSITLAGDVTGTASFDGSANISITATVVDDSHNHTIANVDGLQTALDAKAPLASPALTGIPTAPTASTATENTQIATTAYVNNKITAEVGVANSAVVKTAINASGSAPIYATRVWVNFNGTGTPAIIADGNVTSITDLGVGQYRINFTTALPDANFAMAGSAIDTYGSGDTAITERGTRSASTVDIMVAHGTSNYDVAEISVMVVR